MDDTVANTIRRFTSDDGTPVCIDCAAIVLWTPNQSRPGILAGTFLLLRCESTSDRGWCVRESFEDVDHIIRQARRGL